MTASLHLEFLCCFPTILTIRFHEVMLTRELIGGEAAEGN